ncbi:unnamed protein product, partial [Vitis vinifera]|uniref:Uncharacterized protein n=1 Tax=Vitis vinifera TaxID=29760 RepID=D7TC59_VITVI
MAPDWCYSSLCKSSSINTNPILLFSSFYHKPSFSCSSLPVSKRTQRCSASGILRIEWCCYGLLRKER